MGNDYAYGMINNAQIKRSWPGRRNYLYFDLSDHRADELFARAGISVRFYNEMGRPGSECVIVFCSFWKRYEERFLECMAELDRMMEQEGREDYRASCEEWAEAGEER